MAVVSLSTVYLYNAQLNITNTKENLDSPSDSEKDEPILEYGIAINPFNVETFSVQPNQTLGSIMIMHGVSG